MNKNNKKFGSMFIIIGGVLLILSVVLLTFNKNSVDDNNKPDVDNAEAILKEKIELLTSDKYCNGLRLVEDDMGCIYFRNNTKKSDISPMYKLYYLVLSNINDNTASGLDPMYEESYMEENYLYFITHKIDADKIKSLYIELYGDNDFDINSLDDFETIPKVKYDSLENKFLVYYSDNEDLGSYVLYYPEKYENDSNNYYVYVKCIYVEKARFEDNSNYYLLYKSFDSKESFDTKEESYDILNYDVKNVAEENVSKYKFTFLKEGSNYTFIEVNKIS